MHDKFCWAFEKLIGLEGGYVNHPDDPGGETKFGISKRQYPSLDVATLTLEDAQAIYRKDYWDVLKLDKVAALVAEELFEQAVNFGPGQAVKNLQNALNYFGEDLKVDGGVGPLTFAAMQKWIEKDQRALLKALNGEQYLYYRSLSKHLRSKFAYGWLQRVVVK